MSMNVGQEEEDGEETPMSDINTTPLVDVMLVLLIIFLITVPVVIQTVPVALPKVASSRPTTKPENVSLSVRGGPGGECEVYWGLTRVNSRGAARPGGQEARGRDRAAGRRREHHRGDHARGAYPRRHQHALSLHRRRDLHHAAGRLHAGRLHFRAAAGRRRRASKARRFRSRYDGNGSGDPKASR